MQNPFERLQHCLDRVWFRGLYRSPSGRNWKRIHRLWAIGRMIHDRTGVSAPEGPVLVDGLLATCDGSWLLHCGGWSRTDVPFHLDGSPMRAIRRRVGRSADSGPGALVPVFETIGWE